MATKKKKTDLSSIFSVMSANDTMVEASKSENPKTLFGEYWIEGEVCCLFSDTNVGKSALAVQIADGIARNLDKEENVLYYDFELSKKQFEMRYTQDGKRYSFPSNFKRVELNTEAISESDMARLEDIIIAAIEDNIKRYNSRIVIVDNISWLVNMKNSPSAAGKLMLRLVNLKKEYGLSVLVLAHTTKTSKVKSITNNDLQGSKKFSDFFDAMFAIGQSPYEQATKYFKQIKVRSAPFTHDANHVEVMSLVQENSMLHFKHIGVSTERKVLMSRPQAKTAPNAQTVTNPTKPKTKVGGCTMGDVKLKNRARSIDFIESMAYSAFDEFLGHKC